MKQPRSVNVLLVEDEGLIAMDIEAILESAGYKQIVTATNVAAALRKIGEQSFDVALLDVNLGQEDTVPVAEELARRDIPFLLVTGYNTNHLPQHLRDRPVLRKPYGPAEMLKTIAATMRGKNAPLS